MIRWAVVEHEAQGSAEREPRTREACGAELGTEGLRCLRRREHAEPLHGTIDAAGRVFEWG